jgi:hypothetical protein
MATVDRQESTRQGAPSPVSDELVKLRRGELTLDEYVEARLDEAVAHVKGLLSEEDFEAVREIVRGQMRTDPVLVEMIRRTTGREPSLASLGGGSLGRAGS